MSDNLRIVIAPNEDGFGTSAWVVGVAKELARHPSVSELKVIVATEKREKFHGDKYRRDPGIGLVRLQGQPNRIEVVKEAGAVDVPRTIERCILTYSKSRDEYASALKQQEVIEGADMVVDFGVPHLVRAVYGERLRRTLRKKEIVMVTVFDHAWSLSLKRIVSSDSTRALIPLVIEDSLEDIRNDEALTQEAVLFGEPICPLDYHGYWRRLLGQPPRIILGSLGGPLRTLAYASDPGYERLRLELVENNGQDLPKAAYDQARVYAKQLLGIENDEPTLFISGGGTPVWDEILKDVLDEYAKEAPNYNVVIYNPAEAERRGIKVVEESVSLNGILWTIERAKWGPYEKLIFIGTLEGETHHVLFPAFDLILTRAGGGTVNNATAFRVSLVLVEEPGMWQVEQIRHSCLNMEIAESVKLYEFEKHGRECVESDSGALKELTDQRQKMREIPNHGEIWLCQELLAMVS